MKILLDSERQEIAPPQADDPTDQFPTDVSEFCNERESILSLFSKNRDRLRNELDAGAEYPKTPPQK